KRDGYRGCHPALRASCDMEAVPARDDLPGAPAPAPDEAFLWRHVSAAGDRPENRVDLLGDWPSLYRAIAPRYEYTAYRDTAQVDQDVGRESSGDGGSPRHLRRYQSA